MHVVCCYCDAVNRIPEQRLGDLPVCGRCRKRLFSGKPAALSESALKKQIERSDLPVLVDFWAPWCGPCRMMAPAYEGAAKRLEPDFRVVKVNTEEAQAVSAGLGIRSIPTLMIFRAGREVARQPGAMDEAGIVDWARTRS